jgi:hypothetical protein
MRLAAGGEPVVVKCRAVEPVNKLKILLVQITVTGDKIGS